MTGAEWADHLAWRIAGALPVTKAAGSAPRCAQLARMLTPVCEGMAEVEAGIAENGRRLERLASVTWGRESDGPVSPYPARVEPFRPGEWDVRLTPAGGAR